MERKINPHDRLVARLLVQSSPERRSDAFFQPVGLTSAQFNILNLLWHRAGRMDPAELVDQPLVGKSSISIELKRMVRDGLIQREEHSKDRHQVVLMLTTKGWALGRRISPQYEKEFQEVFGSLPGKRRDPFLDDREILYDALKRSSEAGSEETSSPALRETLDQLASIS